MNTLNHAALMQIKMYMISKFKVGYHCIEVSPELNVNGTYNYFTPEFFTITFRGYPRIRTVCYKYLITSLKIFAVNLAPFRYSQKIPKDDRVYTIKISTAEMLKLYNEAKQSV